MKSTRLSAIAKQLMLAGLTTGTIGTVQLCGVPIIPGLPADYSEQALAQSGGRTRGGSFDRPSSPSRAPSGGYSSPSYSSPYDYSVPYDYPYPSRPRYPSSYRRPSVIVVPPQSYPVPVDPGYGYDGYGYGTSSSGDGLFLVLLVICGVTLLPVLMTYLRTSRQRTGTSAGSNELTNDQITVTQLQVALLAQARYIQDELTQLSLQAKLDTPEGLSEFLRETVLALLRAPENWTHARVSSQTVNTREQASQRFEQLSIQERSKLSAETLVNVGGEIRRQAVKVNQEADPAAYIVVTLLLGTADDQPLAGSVHSAEELAALLKRIGGLSAAYLLVYELIWTPQDASDSLSHDQLLAHYPDLIQIA